MLHYLLNLKIYCHNWITPLVFYLSFVGLEKKRTIIWWFFSRKHNEFLERNLRFYVHKTITKLHRVMDTKKNLQGKFCTVGCFTRKLITLHTIINAV